MINIGQIVRPPTLNIITDSKIFCRYILTTNIGKRVTSNIILCFRGENQKFQKAALTCFATRLVNNNQVTINAFKYVTIISCYDRLPSVGTSPKSRRRGREVANCLMSVTKVLLKDY